MLRACPQCDSEFTGATQKRFCSPSCSTKYYRSKRHPLTTTYHNLIRRCYDPKSQDYGMYGGRGITVCERWLESFDNFLADMGERPKGTSIDRIDNSKGYSPDNCRWSTPREQALNTRKNSAHPNIYFAKHRDAYYVQYMLDGKRISKGNYKTLDEALRVKEELGV